MTVLINDIWTGGKMRILAENNECSLDLNVSDDTLLDCEFTAYCCNSGELLQVKPWLFGVVIIDGLYYVITLK